MKQFKLLMLIPFALTALIGCGKNEQAKTYNLDSNDDLLEISSKTKSVVRNSFGLTKGFTVTSNLNEYDFNLDANSKISGNDISASIEIDDFKGKLDLATSDISPGVSNINTKLSASGIEGDIAFKGSIPKSLLGSDLSIDENISFSDIGFDFYNCEGVSYVDVSNSGLRNGLTSITNSIDNFLVAYSTASKVPLSTLKADLLSIIQTKTKLPITTFDLNTLLDGLVGEGRKIKYNSGKLISGIPEDFDIENFITEIDQELPNIIESLKQADVLNLMTVQTFSDGSFGISLTVNKASLIKILKLFELDILTIGVINAMLSEFDFSISLRTDKDLLISSIAIKNEFEIKGDVTNLINSLVSNQAKVKYAITTPKLTLDSLVIDLSQKTDVVYMIQAGSNTNLPEDAASYLKLN